MCKIFNLILKLSFLISVILKVARGMCCWAENQFWFEKGHSQGHVAAREAVFLVSLIAGS
jgi:hypothetical protein